MTAFWQGPEPWNAFQPAPPERERHGSPRASAATAQTPHPAPQRDTPREVEFVQHAIQHNYNK